MTATGTTIDAAIAARAQGRKVDAVDLGRDLADESRSRFERFRSYVARGWRALDGCDALVFGGGTLFHDRSGAASLLPRWALPDCHRSR